MTEIIFVILQVIVVIVSYLVGKYIIPKLSQDDLKTLELVKNWVEQFVNEAANFKDYTGEEKKKYVSEQIAKILNEKGIAMTEEQISALIETAYNTYIKSKEENATMKLMQQNLVMQTAETK